MITNDYFKYMKDIFEVVQEKEIDSIIAAAQLIADSVEKGGRFYIFGSGHSHMVAEEIYIRAGGLAFVKAILPPELMLHQMPNKSTYLERLDSYSKALLNLYKVDANDTIMIVSNSGRNSVPVEMAMVAQQEINAKVIALNSMEHSLSGASRHSSGKRLYEFADVTLDTHAPKGDAAFYVDGVENPTGPVSDFIGIAIVNAVMVTVIDILHKRGIETPIFRSSNLDGADEYNDELFNTYYGYWK